LPITDPEELAKKEVLVACFVLDIEVPIQGEALGKPGWRGRIRTSV